MGICWGLATGWKQYSCRLHLPPEMFKDVGGGDFQGAFCSSLSGWAQPCCSSKQLPGPSTGLSTCVNTSQGALSALSTPHPRPYLALISIHGKKELFPHFLGEEAEVQGG